MMCFATNNRGRHEEREERERKKAAAEAEKKKQEALVEKKLQGSDVDLVLASAGPTPATADAFLGGSDDPESYGLPAIRKSEDVREINVSFGRRSTDESRRTSDIKEENEKEDRQ